MKKIIIVFILFSTYFTNAQSGHSFIGSDYYKNVDFNEQLWTDEQVYNMILDYKLLKDSLFNDNKELREEFSILKFMPQPDFDEYCYNLNRSWNNIYEWKGYFRDIKNINKIDEWLVLLFKTYPVVGNSVFKLIKDTDNMEFPQYLEKLRNREYLIFIDDNGTMIRGLNTREFYEENKHLKRLK